MEFPFAYLKVFCDQLCLNGNLEINLPLYYFPLHLVQLPIIIKQFVTHTHTQKCLYVECKYTKITLYTIVSF